MKRTATGVPAERKNFFVSVLGKQNETWQGTITLLNRRSTHSMSFPHVTRIGDAKDTLLNSKETLSFRSTTELLRLIDEAVENAGAD
ncbi:MAG: hypothetical protein LBD95_03900 [Clostridiales Family XIII bacterium]|nr:hypothetical protein [Clostridiales Family XIII bacterium]